VDRRLKGLSGKRYGKKRGDVASEKRSLPPRTPLWESSPSNVADLPLKKGRGEV